MAAQHSSKGTRGVRPGGITYYVVPALRYLNLANSSDVSSASSTALAVEVTGNAAPEYIQAIAWVEEDDKRSFLLELLDAANLCCDDDGTISEHAKEKLTTIFVKNKQRADSLAHFLLSKGYPVTSIHGDLRKQKRKRALTSFRSGRTPILVVTAVASQSLDIPNVKHIINFDFPSNVEEYVHSIGRAGHVGNLGLATSFFTAKSQKIAADLVDLFQKANQKVPEWLDNVAKEERRKRSNNPSRRYCGYCSRNCRQDKEGNSVRSGGSGGGRESNNVDCTRAQLVDNSDGCKNNNNGDSSSETSFE